MGSLTVLAVGSFLDLPSNRVESDQKTNKFLTSTSPLPGSGIGVSAYTKFFLPTSPNGRLASNH